MSLSISPSQCTQELPKAARVADRRGSIALGCLDGGVALKPPHSSSRKKHSLKASQNGLEEKDGLPPNLSRRS